MKIEILGSGCPKCIKLESMVRDLVVKQNIKADVSHVYDIAKIVEYGVMMTPALVVDGKVKLAGRLPSENELLNLFR
jgi:small redox-active disulfide protein 2